MRTPSRRALFPRRAIPAAALAAAAVLVSGCAVGGTGGVAGKARESVDTTPGGTAAPGSGGPSGPGLAIAPTPGGKGQNDPALTSFYTQKPAWKACPDDPETDGDEGEMQCAKVRVPLDYAKPEGKSIEISAMRLQASGKGKRIGTLFTNPGGPGGSGIDYLKSWAAEYDADIRKSFDIVGFDPRGVGESAKVVCLSDEQRDRMNAEDGPDPKDTAASDAFAKAQDEEFSAGCQSRSGELLPHVGTRNVARDMDILRVLAGDPKLNYLGYSYGTYLGALYAEEFPDRVGRLVLDGAVDPAADPLDDSIGQTVGFEQSFTRFAKDCAKRPSCPLGTDPARAALVGVDFLDSLRTNPLPSRLDERKLTSSLGWTGMIRLLYADEDQGWEALRSAFDMAMKRGDGTAFVAYADDYNGRDENGRYDGSMDALRVIGCADGMAEAPSPARVQQVLDQLRREAPLFSRDSTPADFSGPGCPSWPFRTAEKPHTVKAPGSDPILVIGTTGDPATPYAASERLAAGFENATLLTLEGEGHTAYGRGNACIDAAVDAYLTQGKMPAEGKRCS
ncbi:alpha/beta hydrolase [Yinghuangia soli]|uniref:Alpha/beta hydrolase n=1 Tax=Yinghuangia soli TaxID=2908204 RepID=A0AA41U140_9ACTN|nr:alpha/beta hydrolase [Yinghuangia soli]MCF2529246.1 alpha/beta hydrolase [Yinghuangia soli]